jgi:hypothetical protein
MIFRHVRFLATARFDGDNGIGGELTVGGSGGDGGAEGEAWSVNLVAPGCIAGSPVAGDITGELDAGTDCTDNLTSLAFQRAPGQDKGMFR